MRAVFLLVGLVVAALALPEDTVVIETGVLQGKVTPMARAFRQIPYAAPPVGNLRWQDPQPAAKWPGTRQGFVDGAGCIQHCNFPEGTHACPITTSEDCLFLTVYTPRLPIYKNVPVMVFLHGGDFFQGHGGSPLYDGSYLANRTNVVVVGVNYRLGALAWLATGSDIKGNYGIRDQIAALQWIQRNIATFGGDPNNVMLFGQSAGAISAAILLTVPSASSLFHRVLMQSEPYTIPLRDKQTMPPVAASFAGSIGCAVTDAACMRGKSADDVLKAQIYVDTDISTDLLHLLNLFLPWTPWVDGDLIPEQPMTALIKGNFPHGMPVIMGNTRGENWIFIYSAFTGPLSPLGYDIVLSAIVGLRNAGKVMAHYPMPPHTADARDHTSLVSTDYVMLCPNRNVTRAMSQFTDMYLFVFDHIASFVEYAWAPNTECYTNVCHASDLVFTFDSGHEFVNYTSDEWTLAASMMDYWAGFAYNGDPNSFKRQPTWPKYVPETSLSMHFQTPANQVDSFFLKADCDFWDTVGYGYGPSGEHYLNTEAAAALERAQKYHH